MESLDVCNLPITWTGLDAETWIEQCYQPTLEPARNTTGVAPLSFLAILFALTISSCTVGIVVHRRSRTQRMAAQLQQIVALERLLDVEPIDRNEN